MDVTSLNNKPRILCLDYGEKRIGIALSDELRLTAQENRVLNRKNLKSDLSAILDIIENFQVGEIVIGMPLNMNGTLGPQAEKVLAFSKKMKSKTDVPIHHWDDRLSSSAVEKVLIEGGVRRQKRKKIIDKMAAQYILQGYLDNKNFKLTNIDSIK